MNFIKNSKVSQKIFGLIILAGIFLAAVGYAGYYSIQQLKIHSNETYNDRLIPMQRFNQISTNTRSVDAYILELMITTDPAKNHELKDDIERTSKSTDELLTNLSQSKLDETSKEKLASLQEQIGMYRSGREEALKLAIDNRNAEAYQTYLSKMVPARDNLNKILNDIAIYNKDLAEKTNEESNTKSTQIIDLMIFLTVVSLVLCSGIGILISRMITRPLKEVQALMQKAKEGDLTVYGTYQSKDEIGMLTTDFNDMIVQLRGIIKQVSDNAVNLSASAQELSAGSEQTSQATQHIAAAIQEVAGGAETQVKGTEESARAIEEMAIGINKIAESSSFAAESSNEAIKNAENGSQIVQKAIEQMRDIHSSVGESAETVKQLGLRSNEIGKIVEVITGIAAQTNLLALNAAIESARAGEHGRGFAVVADEVRKLAEQSKESAESIALIIEQIQSETSTAVATMEKGTQDVENGVNIVQKAEEAFEHIVQSIENIASEIQEVSAASQQMAAGSEQVSASVVEIENSAKISHEHSQRVASSSEEQLASIEEVTASIQELSQMAQELQQMTSRFILR
ncbi:methyl-accepting chemotaxis protein [Aneurinibacillus soli]|uniref:Methyl-accepting chemotaxis protein McpA n=1 Tax=Aneurinibacillus soli TaxID=1500254 RepID=A0A0U5AVU1_9BACL|nr:methyl-accepting chemotaxis protein [Aneurinibacillus soli]PYE61243.1 methyl-accepting chemotaxis protein [Aneurinibacillus soli]BAU26322.1 Methyl-accepting chemotaxis protein McpA [Aneurinibacillus soli]